MCVFIGAQACVYFEGQSLILGVFLCCLFLFTLFFQAGALSESRLSV